MSFWVLPELGIPISCTTVQRLTNLEQQTNEWKTRMDEFDAKIEQRLDVKDSNVPAFAQIDNSDHKLSLQDDPEFVEEFQKVISDESIPDADDYTPDAFDTYVAMEIGLPRGPDDSLHSATVKRRAVDDEGKPIGVANNNPLLDSRQYEVEYLDGTTETLTANVIAENLLAQVDEEGHRQLLMDEIIDHRTDATAITIEEGTYLTERGLPRKKRTTRGWEICVQWKDGSTTWIALKDMKNAYPVQLAEYAVSNKIQDEPAFAWWVPYTLKKRTRIISKLKSKYWQRTHKYGLRIPKTVKEAREIDEENGNRLWQDAIDLEMKNVRVAFELHDGDPTKLVGYQEVTTHLVFDIKLGENFRRKARLVGDGHKTDTPAAVTYSSVVSRDSVRICLLLAALNDLDIKCADIKNAYLTAPNREKVYTWAGPEFGSDEGKPFIIARALYGLKSAGAAFRAFCAEHLDNMGFRSTTADPDVWIRPGVKADGEEYYEYVLVYVDDIMVISHAPDRVMEQIQERFTFKNNEWTAPDTYLGAKIEAKSLNGRNIWTMTSRDYIKAALMEVETKLTKKGRRLPSHAYTPMTSNYAPETDDSPELDPDDITYFQELIGILRWAVELGRVDILTEVSMLSSYQASPRQGHMDQILHIFAFLKRKPKLTLYFDPTLPRLDTSIFRNNADEFKDQYRDAVDEEPPRMPQARGRSVKITSFVDASHAANKVTRRSHTGFILFLNRAPVVWYSKRQNTVESSTFSSEFIALRTCMEYIVALRYKLRMFGVPIDGSADVLCDNESVVRNSSLFESTLNKKHCSLAYHSVRWAVAAEILRLGKIDGKENLADAMTKRLPATTRDYLFGNWTY